EEEDRPRADEWAADLRTCVHGPLRQHREEEHEDQPCCGKRDDDRNDEEQTLREPGQAEPVSDHRPQSGADDRESDGEQESDDETDEGDDIAEDLLDEGLLDDIVEVLVQLGTDSGTEVADESLPRVETGEDADDADRLPIEEVAFELRRQ